MSDTLFYRPYFIHCTAVDLRCNPTTFSATKMNRNVTATQRDLISERHDHMLHIKRRNGFLSSCLQRDVTEMEDSYVRKVNHIREQIYTIYFDEQLPREREIIHKKWGQILKPSNQYSTMKWRQTVNPSNQSSPMKVNMPSRFPRKQDGFCQKGSLLSLYISSKDNAKQMNSRVVSRQMSFPPIMGIDGCSRDTSLSDAKLKMNILPDNAINGVMPRQTRNVPPEVLTCYRNCQETLRLVLGGRSRISRSLLLLKRTDMLK